MLSFFWRSFPDEHIFIQVPVTGCKIAVQSWLKSILIVWTEVRTSGWLKKNPLFSFSAGALPKISIQLFSSQTGNNLVQISHQLTKLKCTQDVGHLSDDCHEGLCWTLAISKCVSDLDRGQYLVRWPFYPSTSSGVNLWTTFLTLSMTLTHRNSKKALYSPSFRHVPMTFVEISYAVQHRKIIAVDSTLEMLPGTGTMKWREKCVQSDTMGS